MSEWLFVANILLKWIGKTKTKMYKKLQLLTHFYRQILKTYINGYQFQNLTSFITRIPNALSVYNAELIAIALSLQWI